MVTAMASWKPGKSSGQCSVRVQSLAASKTQSRDSTTDTLNVSKSQFQLRFDKTEINIING